jgi:hypothetical protein
MLRNIFILSIRMKVVDNDSNFTKDIINQRKIINYPRKVCRQTQGEFVQIV